MTIDAWDGARWVAVSSTDSGVESACDIHITMDFSPMPGEWHALDGTWNVTIEPDEGWRTLSDE